MGLQDRDYMRRRTHEPLAHVPATPKASWTPRLITLGLVMAVASAAIWLLRDLRSVIPDSTPREGSLIVNINTATPVQLESVPGIGPSLAARIIAGRPYEKVKDLLKVSGIGERNLENMRAFLKADGKTGRR